MNCQSLKMKLKSLAENFKMNKTSFIITNETWFKARDRQLKTMLEELEDEYDIRAIRKDRKLGKTGLAHGGVAVFYDSSRCSFRKFQLNALRGKEVREYELLAVRGNLKGIKREIVVFSCYIPPKLKKKEVTSILETLTDAISEAKAKANCPWIVVAGDWNRYNTSSITKLFPDLKKKETGPTRGAATLDYSFSNFDDQIVNAEVCFPVESKDNSSFRSQSN